MARELVRVGKPRYVYLLTVQGDWMIEQTLAQEVEKARAAGFYFRTVHTVTVRRWTFRTTTNRPITRMTGYTTTGTATSTSWT